MHFIFFYNHFVCLEWLNYDFFIMQQSFSFSVKNFYLVISNDNNVLIVLKANNFHAFIWLHWIKLYSFDFWGIDLEFLFLHHKMFYGIMESCCFMKFT